MSSTTFTVKGRIGHDMQVVADLEDTLISVPSNADTVIIQKTNYKYPVYYSLGGMVNTWLPIPTEASGYDFNIAIPTGVSELYLRKPIERRGPHMHDAPPGLEIYYGSSSERKYGDDIYATISVQFVDWR